jgi:hypothetical protein
MEIQDAGANNQESVSTLVRRLKDRNFDVRPLKFDVADAKVPDDATVVVIPGPRSPFPKPAGEAVRNYVAAGGKLIALLPPATQPGQKAMPDTGLEAALALLRVEVTKDRILTYPDQSDQVELASSFFNTPRESRAASTPVAQALRDVQFLPFVDTRVVRPAQGGGGPGPQVDVLLQVVRRLPVLLESDMSVPPAQVFEALKRQGRDTYQGRVQQTPTPMAVMVTEPAAMPSPHGMPPAGGAAKPRALVFGSSWWLGNGLMDDRQPLPYFFDLFAASLDWLRGKPSNTGAESKEYKMYTLSPDADPARLLLLPPLFVLVGIIGLGADVWVARRR